MIKNFCVKRDANNPLWDKYINWLNTYSRCTVMGDIYDYYGVSNNNILCSHKAIVNTIELTLEQWYDMFIFELPEKWYVKPNNLEEAKILAKYFDDNKCGIIDSYSNYLKSVIKNGLSNNGFGYWKGTNHTEITFNQFKLHVLDKMETKQKKDWEILEWSYGYKGEYKTNCPDGTVSDYNIHSVKRLSDGKIFTIGDRVQRMNDVKHSTFVINCFELENDKMKVLTNANGNWQLLNSINHVEEKNTLFTIEDLKNGKCAVINDDSLEKLKKVLKEDFLSSLPDFTSPLEVEVELEEEIVSCHGVNEPITETKLKLDSNGCVVVKLIEKEVNDDSVLAFGYALQAIKNKAPQSVEEMAENEYITNCNGAFDLDSYKAGFEDCYQKAQETMFSEQDVIDFATFRNGGNVREEFNIWKSQKNLTK